MKIIKTRFLCKSGSRTAPRSSSLDKIKWTDRFIEGKWYDGEYETWSFDRGYEINGGWRRYWVINESGEKEEITRVHMRAIFEMNIQELRDNKIDQILNDENRK